MNLCFGKIIEVETAIKSDGNKFVKELPSQCLESLIFNSCELCTMMSSRPTHPFSNIPIFQNSKLLESLVLLVTTYPIPNVMTGAIGIPPQTKIIKYLNEFATKLNDLSSKVENLYVGLKKAVSDAIE